MNYPPGHPTGFHKEEVSITCPDCEEVNYATIEHDLATGATELLDNQKCTDCGKDLTEEQWDVVD